MDPNKRKRNLRERRHRRLRKKVEGTPQRPRLCVFRSSKHIYAQVIDDWNAHSLLGASTLTPALRERVEKTGTVEAAGVVGEFIGRQCLQKGITKLVFDRGGYRYHGRVKALAEAARKQFQDAGQEGF
jgi:large subunit ribosomal protein L18